MPIRSLTAFWRRCLQPRYFSVVWTEVMRGYIFNGCSFGAVLDDVPHYPLRHTLSPGLARAANAPKHSAFTHASGHKPGIDGALDPIRSVVSSLGFLRG